MGYKVTNIIEILYLFIKKYLDFSYWGLTNLNDISTEISDFEEDGIKRHQTALNALL